MACQDDPDASPAQDTYRYSAYGKIIESRIALPHLSLAKPGDAHADVSIGFGTVEDTLASWRGYRRGHIRGQFRYEVVAGRDVVIERLPGSRSKNVADGIMSRVLTAVVYQHGMLPLHASAVAYRGAVVAICGPSGAGKSTLAATLAQGGGVVLADDMVVLDGPDPCAMWGAVRGVKLSVASLHHVDRTEAGLSLANEVEGKFFLPLDTGVATGPVRLDTLAILREGPGRTGPASRLQAMAEWPRCIRMPELLSEAPDPAAVWQRWADMVAAVDPVYVSHGRRMTGLAPIAAYLDTRRTARSTEELP